VQNRITDAQRPLRLINYNTTHCITISRDSFFFEQFPLDGNGASALPLSVEDPHPSISSISQLPIVSDISNHFPPLPRQFLPCSSVVQLPGAIPSSLDDLSSSSRLQEQCSLIIQQPFFPNEVVDNQLSSSSSPASLDDSTEEDFYGFEPVARRSNRLRTPKNTMSLLAVLTVSSDSTISDIDTIDPCNSFSYQEAVLGCDVFWFTAMQIEMSCMETNHTLTLTSLPPDHVAIKVRWMYKVKRYIDGSIKRRRARLVVKGFTQRPGIDFTETSYAPVPMILQFLEYDSLQAILAIAAVDYLDLF
jgi:hypothetical protein